MKRFILSFLFLTFCLPSWSQNDTVYVVFTSTERDDNQLCIWHNKHLDYNKELYRNESHIITIINRSLNFSYKSLYLNWKKQPDNPIVKKPVSFLDTISYIDWDRVGPGLNPQETFERMKNIVSHDRIFFIDRKDIVNGEMELIPVKPMQSSY